MRIFICWSEEKSKQIALALQVWLPKALPKGVEPPFVSQDIPKGSRWFEAVGTHLEEAQAGIICLTPDNLSSPWIHYEAGALAHRLERAQARRTPGQAGVIFTFLHGVSPAELKGPLEAYQSTTSDEADTYRLVLSIAGMMRKSTVSLQDFEVWKHDFDSRWKSLWSELEREIGAPLPIQKLIPDLAAKFRRKTFDEPIDECTAQTWMERFAGARDTRNALEAAKHSVEQGCRRYVADLYTELLAELDGYAMDMSALLLKKFELGADGKVAIEPPGIVVTCERRRQIIWELVAQILDTSEAPIVDEAWRFSRLHTFSEKKVLIHRQERAIREQGIRYSASMHGSYLDSSWDFDRIVCYLILENSPGAGLAALLVDCVRQELERLESMTEQGSLIPLHYAVRALGASLPESLKDPSVVPLKTEVAEDVKSALDDVSEYLAKDKERRDKGGQLKRRIAEARRQLKAPSPIQDTSEASCN